LLLAAKQSLDAPSLVFVGLAVLVVALIWSGRLVAAVGKAHQGSFPSDA
jgi:hypothetical protein